MARYLVGVNVNFTDYYLVEADNEDQVLDKWATGEDCEHYGQGEYYPDEEPESVKKVDDDTIVLLNE